MPRRTTNILFRQWTRKDGTKGGGWYARVRMPDGREVWKACESREEAVELASQLRQEASRIRHGLPVPEKGTRILFRDVVRDYLEWAKTVKRSWKRDVTSLKHLVAFFGDKPLSDIGPPEVEDYRAARRTETTHRGAPPSNPTLNREVRCLTRLVRFAVDRGLLHENRLRKLSLPPESPPRVPTVDSETQARLVAALPQWAKLPVTVAFMTGARAGEICAAKWKDVNLDAGTWTIPMSKNARPRVIPLPPALIEALRPLRGTPEGHVFLCEGRPLQVSSLSHAFSRAAKRIGRPDLRLHDARHAYASRLLAAGASLVEIAALLGHRTLAMAQRYSHASPARLKALVEALEVPTPAAPAEVVTLDREARK